MKKSYFILALIAIISFSSCETDIEVNAPYEDITVVYGLIDPSIDTQYVRINKTFLAEGNAYDLAADPSNFNYPAGDLDVIVQEVSAAGNVVNTYSLVRTVNEVPKDAGDFDNSENVLFRFIEPNINIGSTYKLKIINNVLDKEITSETLIVKNSVVSKPTTIQKLSFWSGSANTGNYLTQLINVTTGKDVGRVDVTLVFNYIEYYTNGDDSVAMSVRMPLGEVVAPTPLGNEVLEWTLEGENFFKNITNAVPVATPSINYREVDYIDIEFNVAGTELSTYMTVTAPSTSVNQDRPGYTNITNGLGIFSSRSEIEWTPLVPGGSYLLNVSIDTMKKLNSLGREFCFGPTTSTSQFGCYY